MSDDDGWQGGLNPLTFTGFAAQTGPGTPVEASTPRRKRRKDSGASGPTERTLRALGIVCGAVVVLVGASFGVDGAVAATGGILIGFGVGTGAKVRR